MKQYGLRGTLPPGDPMLASHLLGPDWHWERWYDSPEARERAWEDLQKPLQYYRQGDRPSQVILRLEREG
jgi:hypothetical protein